MNYRAAGCCDELRMSWKAREDCHTSHTASELGCSRDRRHGQGPQVPGGDHESAQALTVPGRSWNTIDLFFTAYSESIRSVVL